MQNGSTVHLLHGGWIVNVMSRNLIRAYVRAVLRESKEDVADSKDPLFWVQDAFNDPESWGTENPFKAMRGAASSFGLLELGLGSSRIVFESDGRKVIKLARNQRGLEQNKLEATAGKDPYVHRAVASVYDWSDDFAWVVAERLDPLEDGDFRAAESASGVPWADVREILGLSDKSEYKATAEEITNKLESKKEKSAKSAPDCPRGRDFLELLIGFLERYKDMLPGDIVKLSSWGVNDKGCLKLLDFGITRKKFEELYK